MVGKGFIPKPSEGTKETNMGTGSVPEGLEEAVVSARQKYEKGLPFGYNIDYMIKVANEKKAEEEQNSHE